MRVRRSIGWRIALIGVAVLALAALLVAWPFEHTPGEPAAAPDLPLITPRPQDIRPHGDPVPVPDQVRLRVADDVDQPTRDLVADTLKAAGAHQVDVTGLADTTAAPLTVLIGKPADGPLSDALRAAGRDASHLPAEGYALVTGPDQVVLAGADGDGEYHAAQTLRQLTGDGHIAGVSVLDQPSSAVRGVIEGFYGHPWDQQTLLDQLDFYASVKLNTFVYSPKDDPYLRDRWRDPYPPDRLADLGAAVSSATAHHIRFGFAVSPGLSVCYTDPADLTALTGKLQQLYDLGVRDFLVPLDDIDYGHWNCAGDRDRYGDPPNPGSAGQAQVALLNALRTGWADQHDVHSLATVPTEYWDEQDTPYKKAFREHLDQHVQVMWTGPEVIPAQITVRDAERARQVWGRPAYLWDNYPVNDYDPGGRLLLAAYDRRAPGLPEHLTGVLLNPMTQAYPSWVGVLGGADYTWHDQGYDPARAVRAAADRLAGGDAKATAALLAFFDVQHLVPTSTSKNAQPQAPVLAGKLAAFRAAWQRGDRVGAVAGLRPYAEELAATPGAIRAGAVHAGFVAEAAPWLDALELWGRALVRALDGLQARADGSEGQADQWFGEAADLADQAAAVPPLPGDPRAKPPVKVADGVLDQFLKEAPDLH